jgi:hypothetical protein
MVVTIDLPFQTNKLVLCELGFLRLLPTHPASLGAMQTSRLVLGHVSASHHLVTTRIRALDTSVITHFEMILGVCQLALPRAVIETRPDVSAAVTVAVAVTPLLLLLSLLLVPLLQLDPLFTAPAPAAADSNADTRV